MAPDEHPYAPFIHSVKQPAQYLGGEDGQNRKDWATANCTMCLAFPDMYEIGMSHLGYKILYKAINQQSDLLAERAYAVWHDMERALLENDESLRSLENAKALHDFDVVGFSLQYELTYTNVLTMLKLGGIPRLSADREDSHPLVVAGGPTATHAEPLSPFIDVFLIGDGEEKTPELMRAWANYRDVGLPRAKRLQEIAKLGGFYVPSLYKTAPDPNTGVHVVVASSLEAPLPVKRTILEDLSAHPFPADGPVASSETVFDRVSIEIARGCTEGCRFCQAGMIYRPVRERDLEEIVNTIVQAVDEGGYDEASLTSLSTADYSAITPLVQRATEVLKDKKVSLSVSSLRAYGLAEETLDDMKTQRAGDLTFAPEAGSQRIRDVVNKNVTDAQLMETAERVFSRGWSKMKLYFMIGLPTEQEEDILGIVETGARAFAIAKKHSKNGNRARVTVSVSTHVPKPHTPFQWCAMDSYEQILSKQSLLADAAAKTKVQLRMHESDGSWLEGILSRGDRTLAPVISTAVDLGARFDSWQDEINIDIWRQAFEEHAIDTSIFLGTIPVGARLAWDHIDVGLEDGFLAREYKRALKNRLSPPCGKMAGQFVHATNVVDALAEKKRLVCYDCGVACDLTQMREERLVALRKLGTDEKRTPLVEAAESQATVDRRPYRNVDQGKIQRIRLGYTKLGASAFNSHLDLLRVLPRIFRRAKLPLYYSEGFHPLPKMTFGPALALGTFALGEYLDVSVQANSYDLNPAELLERLNRHSLEGIRFFGAANLGNGDRALNRVLKFARYVIVIPKSAIADTGHSNEDALYEHLEQTAARNDLHVIRQVNGKGKRIGKKVDVSGPLRNLNVNSGQSGQSAIKESGLLGEFASFTFEVQFGSATTPRPSEILGVLGLADSPTRIIREGLYAEVNDQTFNPLRIEEFRRTKAAPSTTEAVP